MFNVLFSTIKQPIYLIKDQSANKIVYAAHVGHNQKKKKKMNLHYYLSRKRKQNCEVILIQIDNLLNRNLNMRVREFFFQKFYSMKIDAL